ncbi:MAG: histidine kinase [Actinomycetota bacterium]
MNQRRLAWTIWGISVAFIIAWLFVDASNGPVDIVEYAFAVFAVLLYSTVGALITSRQSSNRVGLLFAWVGLSASISLLAGSYALMAQQRDLPYLAASAWVGRVGFTAMFGPLGFLFLIFPTGRPASRRWGWLLRVMLVAYAVTLIGFALTPGPLTAGFAELDALVANPIGLPLSWKLAVEGVTTAAGVLVVIGALLSVISLIQRYRRAARLERQQIRWLAFLGVFLVIVLVLFFTLVTTGIISDQGAVSGIAFFAFIIGVFLGIPTICGVAILRHGLWDLDVVVRKTVQYGLLVAGFVLVLGIAVSLAPVMFIGVGGSVDLPTLVVAGVLAIGFTLVRSRARRWANRIVYGKRSTPYEVLSEFAERVGETYSTEDVLPRMAQLLGEASGARSARVWLRIGNEMRAEASWPPDAPSVPDVPVRSDELPPLGDDDAFEVRHQAELLGALSVAMTPADPMNATKAKLARDMAAQAGLVLRNVRLIEDLRESRRRIVSAQDERARSLERNIHDGAQQQLVALSVKLRLAEGLVERDPEKARTILADLQVQATETLGNLRDLARGIYPPLLADKGLPAALEAQARRSPVPVTVHPDGVGRYGQDVESAIYFCCLEALNNVAKYADASAVEIRLQQSDGTLRFEVSDDGRGFDTASTHHGTGLQGIADRLDALGGRLEIRTAPGEGTTLVGLVPSMAGEA